MANVLDLKNPAETQVDSETTTEIALPVEAVPVEPEAERADLLSMVNLADFPQTITWEAEDTLRGSARRKHYILMGLLAVAGAAIALWQSSFMVFVVVLAGIGALEARQRWSKPVEVAVDEHGIGVDGRHYPHTDFTSYDIHLMPDETIELSLHSNRWNVAHMRLPLGGQNHEEVRAVLSQYIPVGRHPIPILDYLIRKP